MPMPDDKLLCALADGELDANAARDIEALAERHPAVRERIALYRRSGDLLRAALSDADFADVPRRLEDTIDRALRRKQDRSKKPAWLRQASVAAALMVGIASGAAITRYVEHGAVLPRSAVAAVMHEVAEYHPVYAREVEHLAEVPASRREHIEAWLGERLGLALKAPDLGAYGLTFHGARLVALQDQVLAQLMYTDEADRRLALCVTRLVGSPSDAIETIVENGLKLRGLSRGRHVFLVVGPAEAPAIDRVAPRLPALLASF